MKITEVWTDEGPCGECQSGDHGKETKQVRYCTCCGLVLEEVTL